MTWPKAIDWRTGSLTSTSGSAVPSTAQTGQLVRCSSGLSTQAVPIATSTTEATRLSATADCRLISVIGSISSAAKGG